MTFSPSTAEQSYVVTLSDGSEIFSMAQPDNSVYPPDGLRQGRRVFGKVCAPDLQTSIAVRAFPRDTQGPLDDARAIESKRNGRRAILSAGPASFPSFITFLLLSNLLSLFISLATGGPLPVALGKVRASFVSDAEEFFPLACCRKTKRSCTEFDGCKELILLSLFGENFIVLVDSLCFLS